MRSLNLEMGSPVNRFTVYGRESARALRQVSAIDGISPLFFSPTLIFYFNLFVLQSDRGSRGGANGSSLNGLCGRYALIRTETVS